MSHNPRLRLYVEHFNLSHNRIARCARMMLGGNRGDLQMPVLLLTRRSFVSVARL